MGQIYKVTVIIPAYNVEKYIEKCVRSVIEQTYTNLEIIVVNDGSTDETLSILQKLQTEDLRIRVLDKVNGGVSAARNSGLDLATGDYVAFIDGDDFWAKDYVEYMLHLVDETKSEFCLTTNKFVSKNDKQVSNPQVKTMNSIKATALLLSPDVVVGCWNKIYSKNFLDENNLRFSTELFYGEGLDFITRCAQLAKIVGVGNRRVYYYRKDNMVSATTKFNIEKCRNGEKALFTIKSNLLVQDKIIDTMFNLHLANYSLGAMVKIIENKQKKNYKDDYIRYKKYLHKNTPTLIFNSKISLYRKLLLFVGCAAPSLVAFLNSRRIKKIITNSVR